MKIDIGKAAKKIGIPMRSWAGRCYEIACLFVEKGVVNGTPVYGHWLGKVDPKAQKFGERSGLPFQHHGWVLMKNGTVVDPTRWVFENAKPYVFIGKPPTDDRETCTCGHRDEDHEGGFFCPCSRCDCQDFALNVLWPYDEGGNRWKSAMRSPPPPFNPDKVVEKFNPPPEVFAHCRMLLKQVTKVMQESHWSTEQLFWIANLPYEDHGGLVHEVYQALAEADLEAAVPIDNRRRAKREYGDQHGRRKRG